MTVSTHVYTAVLIGSPDLALRVKGGRITLDAGNAPHVDGTIDIAIPTMSTLTALDPRLNKRIRVTVSVSSPSFSTVTRTFNLGLRDRDVRHADGSVSLRVSSDEELLDDYAPLTDDATPFTHQASLRSVVNYVLNKAIPGAALAASPANNADVTTYSDSTNLIIDPSNEGVGGIFNGFNVTLDKDDTSWSAHGSKSINMWSPTDADSYMSIGGDAGDGFRLGMNAGKSYTFSATGRVKQAVGGTASARARRLVAFARDQNGAYFPVAMSPQLPTTVGAATRVAVTFTIPPDATEAFIRAYNGHTSGQVQWDAFRLSDATEDPTDTGYYDGATAATAAYTYAWREAVNGSVSVRTALINRDPASLLWKAGQTAWEFLHPLVQALGFRLVCNESRVWTLRDEGYAAPGSLNIRHAINMIDGSDQIARDSDAWYDAAVTIYEWTDAAGFQRTQEDAYALTTPYTRLRTFRKSTPFPGFGFSEYAVRRAQGRGREVSATAVADWSASAEQDVSIILVGAPTQVGATSSVTFNLDRDEMTVNTRTVDTPLGAIDLLSGSINSKSGTINALTS